MSQTVENEFGPEPLIFTFNHAKLEPVFVMIIYVIDTMLQHGSKEACRNHDWLTVVNYCLLCGTTE